MISRAGMNTNFGTGMGKVYGHAIVQDSLDLSKQMKTLSDAAQAVQTGGYKYMGNKYEFLDRGNFAQMIKTEHRTGLHVLQSPDGNIIIMHKERDLDTGTPASISIIENNQDLRTVNDDEPQLGSLFSMAKNAITNTFQQISERIQK